MKQEMTEDAKQKWLFDEGVRLEQLREELAKASKLLREEADIVKQKEIRLTSEKQRFESEKAEFKLQMHDWTSKIRTEREKLEEEQNFFDKKFKILEMGFKQLDADRRSFEAKKRAFEYRKYEKETQLFESFDADEMVDASVFFRGVNHPLALKKRYKDLIKIYHPDNLDGDKSVLQQINLEYDKLKKVITYQKKA